MSRLAFIIEILFRWSCGRENYGKMNLTLTRLNKGGKNCSIHDNLALFGTDCFRRSTAGVRPLAKGLEVFSLFYLYIKGKFYFLIAKGMVFFILLYCHVLTVVLSHHQLQHGVFLLESSLFRTKGEFESQINFVKSIAKRLQVSPTGTRAGVILYGDEPKLSIGLNDYSTLPELYNLLDNLAHESGGRQLHKALTLAGETLQKSPQEIPKFVVVILEGQQYSSGSLLLRDAVKPLQALGVTIYVVGIGEKLNRQELYTMVQTSRYIIQVPRFTELLRQMEFIAYRIETTITDPCHETLDLGFVIDASGSVGMDTFSREKNFVKLVSRRFAATSPNTRLGLLVFSDTPKLFVDFADYESKTIEQFQANVAQATFQDGRSRIDLALRAASQDFFTNRRSGVPRVLILVSDGRQSEDPGYYPLATAVKPLQAQRVRIVGVGFGDSVDVENLKEITGSKDRILLDQEINDIDRLQMELVSKACEI